MNDTCMADEKKPKDPEKDAAKKTAQDDDVVGKAYDGRLMRRLLTYLRPYKLQTALSALRDYLQGWQRCAGAVPGEGGGGHLYDRDSAGAAVVAGAEHLSTDADDGNHGAGGCSTSATLLLTFGLEFLQTYLMQWTGQKIMFDLRSQIFRHLQRMHPAFFDHNPVGGW